MQGQGFGPWPKAAEAPLAAVWRAWVLAGWFSDGFSPMFFFPYGFPVGFSFAGKHRRKRRIPAGQNVFSPIAVFL